METKTCQNCNQEFTLTEESLNYLQGIKVPAPTFCPKCRFQRRFIWRNERTLYKGACALCSRGIITIYSPDKPYSVYCNECYYGDGWDPSDYAQDYDFNRPFFEQFKELQQKVPRLYAFVTNNINSEYTNGSQQNKNCYLIFVSDHNEDSLYSYGIFNCKNTVDCYSLNDSERCYESINCIKCYKVNYSIDCSDSQNLYFCKNCINCQDCIGSANLRNKKYHIFNKPYSKEEYFEKLKELNLDSREGIKEIQKKAETNWTEYINKFIHGVRNIDTSGDYVHNSKNSQWVFDCEGLEDSDLLNHGHGAVSCRDCYVIVDNSQFSYEVVSGIDLNNVKFSYCAWNNSDLNYCDTCVNCSNLFGCIGLRKKQYCILNKQYSKEEYEAILPKIIQHMSDMPYQTSGGRLYKYGEFFPNELSPFAYNETVAQEYFPLTEAESSSKGYVWKEKESSSYNPTILSTDLPSTIAEVDDSILKETIECTHKGECEDGCAQAFKITPQELLFYKQENIPLPQLCHNCRHYRRLKYRSPLNLWPSKCQCSGTKSSNSIYQNIAEHSHGAEPCPNEFETTYGPDRPEIVYCEQCYQQEVN